jgi:zinc transporter
LKERIKLLHKEIAAQFGAQTNRSLLTLTVVTVLTLPINIVAGLLGMNVDENPLALDVHGFYIIIGIIFSFTVLAGWPAFRRLD